ncbi:MULTISPECIES: cytochrome b [unclassified Microbulbifer]|uniref:cytochrome b n=1 Tax=unclassified Microbulbifer TaxID=2619833 RepID=UPI0027E44A94|nr:MULTISPECIES: cytochrome b [unclassified Microbulbifer]
MQTNTDRWNPVSKGLHWLVAVLLLCAWGAVELHEFYERGDPMRSWWTALHFSLGLTILLLVTLRLYWRARHPRPAVTGAAWQQKFSSLMHGILYLILLAMPLSGFSMRQLAGRDTEFFGLFALPRLLPENMDVAKQLAFVHKELLWNSLLVLLAVHIAAALWHHFVVRDNTLTRMFPQR